MAEVLFWKSNGNVLMAQTDHDLFKLEYGISDELERQVLELNDVCFDPIPNVFIDASAIEGKGAFVNKPIPSGYAIGWANRNHRRTILGRYINHSPNPNCYPLPHPDGFLVVSDRYIKAGQELTFDYRDVMRAHIRRNLVLDNAVN